MSFQFISGYGGFVKILIGNKPIVVYNDWRYFVIFGCGSTFGVLSRGVAVVAFHFDLVKVGCSIQPPATIEY